MDQLNALWEWLTSAQTTSEVAGRMLATIATSVVVYLFSLAGRRALVFFHKRRSLARLPLQYQRYRERLNADTFRLHHPWMKEGQVLDDILVSVNVETRESGGAVDFQQFFDQHLRAGPSDDVAPRLIITGAPGSGKSVAIRMAARSAWGVLAEAGLPRYVPVLLTFAEFRKQGFDVEAAVLSSLRARGFADGDADPEESRKQFVRERFREGALLLFDGLDELKREDRVTAIDALCSFAKRYRSLPLVIACRSIPFREHRAQFAPLHPKEVEMASFTPAAVRRFVKQWKFDPPKSATELIGTIETRPHLQDLAKNPLMLTITTFLYALPKYRLPDNRAQFYEICSRALLEEWDQSQAPERANQFDRPHKEELLARLARDHLVGKDPESDISEAYALSKFAKWLGRIGLSPSQNVKALREIMDNSGLLVSYPPDGLRFPHQTFLEYFAALYYLRYGQFKDLAELSGDMRRTREILILYCGLTTDAGIAAKLISEAIADGDVDFAIEVVCNAQRLDREAADAALDQAAKRIAQTPTPNLIEHLGYLARNPVSAFAEKARGLLNEMFNQNLDRLSDPVLEALVLAVARSGQEQEINRVIENFDRLRLSKILPLMGEHALMLIARVVAEREMPREKLLQWIESLYLAEMPRLLYETMNAAKDPEVRSRAGIALGQLSQSGGFFEVFDDPELSEPVEDTSLARLMQRWGWPRPLPATARGKKILVTLALQLSRGMSDGTYAPFDAPKKQLHPWLSYLAHALFWEEHFPKRPSIRSADEIVAPQTWISNGTPQFSRTLWGATDKQITKWVEMVEKSSSGEAVLVLSFIVAMPLALIWSVLSVVFQGAWALPPLFAALFLLGVGGPSLVLGGILFFSHRDLIEVGNAGGNETGRANYGLEERVSNLFLGMLFALPMIPVLVFMLVARRDFEDLRFDQKICAVLVGVSVIVMLVVVSFLYSTSWLFGVFVLFHAVFVSSWYNSLVGISPRLYFNGDVVKLAPYLVVSPERMIEKE